MVEGPRARLAWAVLDAQWFGVAQRRRRVFVVIDFGGAVDPAAVLLEPDRLRGDHPPRRQAGQNPAPTLCARPSGGGGLGTDFDLGGGLIAQGVAPTLDASFARLQGASRQDARHGHGHLVTFGGNNTRGPIDAAAALNAHGGPAGRLDFGSETFVTHALRGEGLDAGEDGTGRGTPIVPVAGGRPEGEATGHFIPVAFDCKDTEVQFADDGSHPTPRSMGHSTSHQNAGGHAAIAFAENSRAEVRLMNGDGQIAPQLTKGGGKPGQGHPCIATAWAVRRLTPPECARLQGFPDNYTRIEWGGKPAAQCPDGPQYKAYGNSMAVPVVRYIDGRQLRLARRHGRPDGGGPWLNPPRSSQWTPLALPLILTATLSPALPHATPG